MIETLTTGWMIPSKTNSLQSGYHPPNSQCFYHYVDTYSVGGLLVLEGIIRPLVNVSITR
jgi:hypothetical protein